MMNVRCIALIGVFSLLVAGCQQAAPQVVSPPPARAAVEPAPAQQETIINTSLMPIDAVKHAAVVLNQKFGLDVTTAGETLWWFDMNHSVTGDNFYAEASAKTFQGKSIFVKAELIKAGQTRVEIRSELSETQHEALMMELDRALEEAMRGSKK